LARLVIVSNRVAMPRERLSRAGGLAVALRESLQQHGGLWFGWSGEVEDNPSPQPRRASQGRVSYAVLDLSPDEHKGFYLEFANATLWPLCHYRLGLIDFHRSSWEAYLAVNARFAEQLVPLLKPDDVIWIHDYHFIPLAAELRRRGVQNRIGFFLHIPFPAPEVLAALPGHERLVRDLCAYDLVGFQTQTDMRALTEYILHEAGGTVGDDGRVNAYGRSLRVGAFPIGIDTQDFAEIAAAEANSDETRRLVESLAGRDLVIGVDRLDYSKGIPQRFESFHHLLANRPEHRGKVTFMQIAVIGPVPFATLVVIMAATIGAGFVGARLSGQSSYAGLLAGGATAICGASAALALYGVIGQQRLSQAQFALTLVGIALASALAMTVYPLLAAQFGLSDAQAGFLIGASVHDVAQAIGGGYAFSDAAGASATIVKLARVALLAPVVALVGLLLKPEDGGDTRIWRRLALPWFITAFFAMVTLNSALAIPDAARDIALTASKALLLLAVTATAMRTRMDLLLEMGWRAGVPVALATLTSFALSLIFALAIV